MGIISKSQLTHAMRDLGYHPRPEYIAAMVDATNRYFDDKHNAAMFLGQCAHESTGYHDAEELEYVGRHHCPYRDGAPGECYHGRGFIQLTTSDNYRRCGSDIGRDIYRNPDSVAEQPDLAARVSVWYWQRVVENYHGFNPRKHFGITTKAINGVLECNGRNERQSRNRYRCYKAVCEQMGINPADECGCYN